MITTKTILIVGVNQGIGFQLTESMLKKGYKVIGLDKILDNITNTISDSQLSLYLCDITSEEQVKECCQKILTKNSIDYFVYVAGVIHTAKHHVLPVEQWKHMFAVNVEGAFYFMRYLSTHFQKGLSSSLVFVSSNAAKVPRVDMSAYGASKAALSHFVKAVGLELAEYGVRVNLVSPGSTLTPMLLEVNKVSVTELTKKVILGNHQDYKLGIPLKKLAQAQDIVNTIEFLLEPASGHITMQDIVVDGGATL